VHYVNFEEIWSDFPKFRKFENRRKKKPREISENFPDFQIRKFGKVCAFSVFSQTRSAQQGTPSGKNRYKSENFGKVVENRKTPKFPENRLSRFSGFLYVAKIQPISAKFRMKFSEIGLF
jgi:hypothetical protein